MVDPVRRNRLIVNSPFTIATTPQPDVKMFDAYLKLGCTIITLERIRNWSGIVLCK